MMAFLPLFTSPPGVLQSVRNLQVELMVLLGLAQGHSEPFRGRRDEAPPLTQSPHPSQLTLRSLGLPLRAQSV